MGSAPSACSAYMGAAKQVFKILKICIRATIVRRPQKKKGPHHAALWHGEETVYALAGAFWPAACAIWLTAALTLVSKASMACLVVLVSCS